MSENSLKIKDTILFGNYPQGENGEIKPIEWIVLDIKDNEIILISKFGLDARPYKKEWIITDWESCFLREWLNNDFYNKAFNIEEKNKILLRETIAEENPDYKKTAQGNNTKDYVSLLSINEALKYFNNDDERKCFPSKYAIKNGVNIYIDCCWWWLRTLGGNSFSASCINYDGFIFSEGYNIFNYNYAIRPIIKIKL